MKLLSLLPLFQLQLVTLFADNRELVVMQEPNNDNILFTNSYTFREEDGSKICTACILKCCVHLPSVCHYISMYICLFVFCSLSAACLASILCRPVRYVLLGFAISLQVLTFTRSLTSPVNDCVY